MIELEHIFVSYTKEFNTLQDISFTLGDGDKLVIVGEKESGRTALLRTIVGLDKCKSGTIVINGTPIDKINFKEEEIKLVELNNKLEKLSQERSSLNRELLKITEEVEKLNGEKNLLIDF